MEATTGSSDSLFCNTTSTYLTKVVKKLQLTAYQLSIQRAELYVLGSVFIASLVGNLCVLVWIVRRRVKQNRMNLFIIHLVVADLATAFFQVLPEWLIRIGGGFHSNDAACKLLKYLQIVSMYASTYVLLSAAFDRYMAIRHPMMSFKSSKKSLHIRIVIAWTAALIMSLPQIFLFERPDHTTKCSMIKSVTKQFIRGYVTWYFVSVLVIPTCLLVYFYGRIASVIMKNLRDKNKASRGAANSGRKSNENFAPRASSIAMISRAKIKTVKMTLVIVITYVACWLPFFLVQLLGVWNAINRDHIVSSVLHLVACLNSCTNPWIYFYFSGRLGKEINCVICRTDLYLKKDDADREDHPGPQSVDSKSPLRMTMLSRDDSMYLQTTKTSKVVMETSMLSDIQSSGIIEAEQ